MIVALLWNLFTGVAFSASCGDDPSLDCDGDGWTQGAEDCDDDEPLANPGAEEDCDDDIDNNCDGLFNEECDGLIRSGELGGGGACTAGNGVGGVSAVLLPMFWLGRRREQVE